MTIRTAVPMPVHFPLLLPELAIAGVLGVVNLTRQAGNGYRQYSGVWCTTDAASYLYGAWQNNWVLVDLLYS